MNLGQLCPKLFHIMSWMFHYIWILPLCMGTIIKVVETEQTKVFAWNRSNPMFQEHADGARLSIPVWSNLVIKCPYKTDPLEYYKIYWLPEEAFKNCFWPSTGAQLLVNCNKPNISQLEFVQQITTFTGVPGGKDFTIGEKYYITTLSTGTEKGLTNQYDGACHENNMRLTITITEQQAPSTNAPTPTPNTTHAIPASTTKEKTTEPPPTKATPRPTPRPTTPLPTTTTETTTRKPITPDIPDPTEIIINVPDNGNSAVIDANSSNRLTCNFWSLLALPLCLSVFHILNFHHHLDIQR